MNSERRLPWRKREPGGLRRWARKLSCFYAGMVVRHMPMSSSTYDLSIKQRSETPELLVSYLARIVCDELLSHKEEIDLIR